MLVAMFVSVMPVRMFAGWEIDWDLIRQVGNAAVRELQDGFDGRHVRELLAEADVDWTLTGRYIDQMLQGVDWESLALLHPYAHELLALLEGQEGNAEAADWLRQRIEYLAMAETYVQRERSRTVPRDDVPDAPAPPAPTPPRPSAPAPAPTPTPPAPSPRTQPSTPSPRIRPPLDWDAETRAWLERVPAQPSVIAQEIVPDLKRIFEGEGVPPVLVWLAEVESSFNPSARSPAGAVGLFQFMPATAGRFGLRLEPVDQRTDPLLSARAAAQYLRILHRQFHDWQLALAAYNAGEGRVGRILRQTGGSQFGHIADNLPLETRMYVPRIAALVNKREQVDIRLLPAPL